MPYEIDGDATFNTTEAKGNSVVQATESTNSNQGSCNNYITFKS